MNFFYAFAGISLLITVYADLCYTTLSTSGAGILSGRISRGIWTLMFTMAGNKARAKLLNYAGMSITLGILTAWIVLAWMGSTLLFMSDTDSIRHGQTNAAATVWEKVYYAGYSFSTLGNGDFYATTAFWRIYTIIVSLSGLSMVTIGITYLVQVLTSETAKRQLALHIATLGGSPQDILLNSWDGKSFQQFESEISSLISQILAHSQQHLAYPIIHYFHTTKVRESSTVNIVALDEAMTLMLHCVEPTTRPNNLDLKSLRAALTAYLLTLEDGFIKPAEQELPRPDFTRLKAKGIPLLDDEAKLQSEFDRLGKRRKLLRALLEYAGWNINDLNVNKFRTRLEELQ